VTLSRSIRRLKEGIEAMRFADADFRDSSFIRLKVLNEHVQARRLTEDLRWSARGAE
jgi:UDP-glucose 4-epimerase